MRYYGYKNVDKEVVEGDITADNIIERIEDAVAGRKVDIIIGGPPCQAYSTAGRVRDKEGIQKQFEDRLFDRDTLLLREYYINLFFVMRAYATREDWSDELHTIIRNDLIQNLNRKYSFYKIRPKDIPVPFVWAHFHEIIGKAYRTGFFDDDIILAFENSPKGQADRERIFTSIQDDIEAPAQQFYIEPDSVKE